MSKKISGECPVCRAETLYLVVNQGDSMRITGGPTFRVTVKADIYCTNRETQEGWCEYREHSAPVDVTLEFGEALR